MKFGWGARKVDPKQPLDLTAEDALRIIRKITVATDLDGITEQMQGGAAERLIAIVCVLRSMETEIGQAIGDEAHNRMVVCYVAGQHPARRYDKARD